MKKQLHVLFSGRVQGVGFRYTTSHLARTFKIAGWVRNLGDGRVEMTAEGDEAELQKFLRMIQERMKNNIQDTKVHWKAATGEFHEFEITY